jgi:hypothetical protein
MRSSRRQDARAHHRTSFLRRGGLAGELFAVVAGVALTEAGPDDVCRRGADRQVTAATCVAMARTDWRPHAPYRGLKQTPAEWTGPLQTTARGFDRPGVSRRRAMTHDACAPSTCLRIRRLAIAVFVLLVARGAQTGTRRERL